MISQQQSKLLITWAYCCLFVWGTTTPAIKCDRNDTTFSDDGMRSLIAGTVLTPGTITRRCECWRKELPSLILIGFLFLIGRGVAWCSKLYRVLQRYWSLDNYHRTFGPLFTRKAGSGRYCLGCLSA
jgi:hypothetical protein